jgi:taurine transport system ATP-binding protein
LLASRVAVLSSNPGRLAADIQTGFAAELLGGASVAQVKASPFDKRTHDGLTGLIHSISEDTQAAA